MYDYNPYRQSYNPYPQIQANYPQTYPQRYPQQQMQMPVNNIVKGRVVTGIEEAEREANAVTATINQSYQQAERVESEVTNAGEAIRECRKSIERCQQLITTIRARAEPDPK